MFVRKALLASVSVVLIGSGILVAADPPSSPAARRSRGAQLDKPYSELKDLTDAQRTQIVAAHQKSLDQIKEIRAKERAEIMMILTDDQKKELVAIEAKDREASRERRSSRATTQPSRTAG